MALLKSFEQIEELIPERVDDFYHCGITATPIDVAKKSHIYAIVVDGKTKKIIKTYEVKFTLFSGSIKHYLFIGEKSKDVNTANYFISANTEKGQNLKKTDWKFETDNLGLHAKCGMNKDIIYFGDDASDINDIMRVYNITSSNKTIITDVVYA